MAAPSSKPLSGDRLHGPQSHLVVVVLVTSSDNRHWASSEMASAAAVEPPGPVGSDVIRPHPHTMAADADARINELTGAVGDLRFYLYPLSGGLNRRERLAKCILRGAELVRQALCLTDVALLNRVNEAQRTSRIAASSAAQSAARIAVFEPSIPTKTDPGVAGSCTTAKPARVSLRRFAGNPATRRLQRFERRSCRCESSRRIGRRAARGSSGSAVRSRADRSLRWRAPIERH